jgi:uncharacterized membrane protein
MNKKIILLFLLLILLLPFTFAREYEINNIDINYTIDKTGVISVTENWEYEFTGCYKEIFITKPNVIISDESGFCENENCLFEYKKTNTISRKPELILKGDFCDKSVTANFNYTINNEIYLLQDKTQFYYFIFGGGIEKSSPLNINLFFPGDVNQTKFFIHSKNYDSKVNKNQINISKRVLANEVIEINVLMPKDWFDITLLPVKDSNSSIVVSNEANWQKDYDSYIKENVKKEFSLFQKILIIFLIFFIPFLFYFLVWFFFGKEYTNKQVNYFGVYERDLPKEEDPLKANYFIFGDFSKDWFSSAIMYLVWKKQYILEKNNKNYVLLKVKNSKDVELPSYVKQVNDFLKKHYPDGQIDLDLFTKRINNQNLLSSDFIKNRSKILKLTSDFNKLFSDIYLEYSNWFSKSKCLDKRGVSIATGGYIFFIFLLFLLMAVKNYIFPNKSVFFIILFIFSMFLPIILNFKLLFGRFSKEARVENLKWSNFKKYITDYSLMKEHPPRSVIIWEEYMVYATVFGVAKQTSNVLKVALPEERSNYRFVTYSGFVASSNFRSLQSYGFVSGSGHAVGGGRFGGGFGGGGGAR